MERKCWVVGKRGEEKRREEVSRAFWVTYMCEVRKGCFVSLFQSFRPAGQSDVRY